MDVTHTTVFVPLIAMLRLPTSMYVQFASLPSLPSCSSLPLKIVKSLVSSCSTSMNANSFRYYHIKEMFIKNKKINTYQ